MAWVGLERVIKMVMMVVSMMVMVMVMSRDLEGYPRVE